MRDELYMNRCFQLALLGSGNVAPNPLVGAVLVHNEQIISEGFHAKYGGPHAEVMALNTVSDKQILENSTLYVSLEPCSHTGKTPPCTDLIIAKGIKNVVVSVTDPYPAVNGAGIKQLIDAGINVTNGILESEGKFINRRFITYLLKKRPYVILKWAQSADGFIAPHPSEKKGRVHWISNPASQLLVHRWRSEEQSILVGRKTITADNPFLNVREIEGNDPVKIIIDPNLTLDENFNIFKSPARTLIFNLKKSISAGNVMYVKIENSDNFIPEILDFLYAEKIQSILVEGGKYTLDKFISEGFWDEARVFTGSDSLGTGIQAPEISGAIHEHHTISGDDLKIYLNSSGNNQ